MKWTGIKAGVLFLVILSIFRESQSRGCRDMIWPGGQNPCPNLIKSPLYDTADQFCAAPYYAKHCCATCQRWKDRKITRRQLDDNLLMSKLKEAFLSNE